MFRHKGKTRTYKHNLQIASLLSFVAGIVDVIGFLSVQRLTTNVTGHFAYLIDEVFKMHLLEGLIFFLFIFFFFLGSFFSSFMVEIISRKKNSNTYVIPTLIESGILILVGLTGNYLMSYPNMIALALLFAMGLQNSLVTSISNATVRTTHLTGLFTDMGIEVSQWFFYKDAAQREKLKSSMKLRITIISFFFLGGVFGGFIYRSFHLYSLLFPAFILLGGLIIDGIKLRMHLNKRRRQAL